MTWKKEKESLLLGASSDQSQSAQRSLTVSLSIYHNAHIYTGIYIVTIRPYIYTGNREATCNVSLSSLPFYRPNRIYTHRCICKKKLQPNYVCDRIFDPSDTDENNPLGKWKRELVELQPGDRFYIDIPKGEEENFSVLVFAGFSPRGGPQYGLGVNTLLDPAKIRQRGLEPVEKN